MDTEALDEEFVDQVELTIIITPTLSLQKKIPLMCIIIVLV